MKTKPFWLTNLWLVMLLIACFPAGITPVYVTPTPQPVAEATIRQVTATPTPTATPSPSETPPPTAEPSTDTPTATTEAPPTATPSATPTPETWVGPYTFPEGINPLTGLPVDDPAVLTLRPVAAKISNAPPIVRPQAGIGQADVVFEHYAEGGLTRFTAIFLSHQPRRVGSVRSARLIDVEIPEMFESYLVYSGSSQGVRERIEATAFAGRAFYGVETGPPAYYRDSALPIPHNLFADLVAVHDLAARREVNTPPAPNYSALAFAPDPPPVPSPGDARMPVINLHYRGTRVLWRYDDERAVYLRWSDGEPHFDSTTEQQVSADNVVVLYANHVETDIVESEWQGGRSYSIEIQLWGEGPALFFRDGQRYEGTWERPNAADMFLLRDADGEVMRLKPGVTFFQLVPLDFGPLTVEE